MSAEIIAPGGREVGSGFVVDPDAVLSAALGECEMVVVIGRKKSGGPPFVASSHGQEEMLAELEVARHWMMTEIAAVRGW